MLTIKNKNYLLLLAILGITYAPYLHSSAIQQAQANSVLIQSNGYIVASGSALVTGDDTTECVTARYTTAGAFDTSFASSGIALNLIGDGSDVIQSAIQESDSKIVSAGNADVGGSTSSMVLRYNTNGSLDTSFGTNGIVTFTVNNASLINSITIQSNGQILALGVTISNGAASLFITRLNSNGSTDTTFGTNGVAIYNFGVNAIGYDMVLQSDGQIIVVGTQDDNLIIMRLNSADGSLDTTYNTVGYSIVTINITNASASVALQSTGEAILAGNDSNQISLTRFNTNGTIDTTFGTNGNFSFSTGNNTVVNDITTDSSDNIVIAGFSDTNGLVARCLSTGSGLDTSFNTTGYAFVPASSNCSLASVAIQSNAQIIVAGSLSMSFIIARYNTNGALDVLFANNGIMDQPGPVSGPTNLTDANIAADAGIEYSKLNLIDSIVDSDISSSANISNSKLATLTLSGLVANSATTATNANTANAIIQRDAYGNFIANKMYGNVVGYATSNILRYGDNIPGTITFPVTSATGPAILFNNSTDAGFFSATANVISVATNGVERTQVTSAGGFVVNNPDSGVGLTVNGGGASITGNIAGTGNVTYTPNATNLNAVGSTLSGLNVYTVSTTTGLSSSVTVSLTSAGYANTPAVFIAPTNGSFSGLSITSISSTSVTIQSTSPNVAFNLMTIGT